MAKAYLSLGSNLGNKKENIDQALHLLSIKDQIKIKKISSYYETEPVGYKDQDWFLNIVTEIETALEPYSLLKYCNLIEQKLKRKRTIKWGPRTIDIDILLYENFSSNDEVLIIPHGRMTERAFVMVPLYEIAPDLLIEGEHIKKIVENLPREKVKKVTVSND